MAKSKPRSASKELFKHPAMATTALGAIVTAGLGTVLLLIAGTEHRVRRLTRKVVPPASDARLENALRSRRRTPSLPRIAAVGLLMSAGVAAALIVLDAIVNHDSVVRLDRHIHSFFRRHRTTRERHAIDATTVIGSPGFVAAADTLGVIALLRRDRVREAIALLWTLVAMLALGETLKKAVRRKRPPEGMQTSSDQFSFPSGHTLVAASSYGMLAYFMSTEERSAWRFVAAGTFAFLVPWTAFSRVFLGKHWTSDTIASVALASAWDAGVLTLLRVE